MSARPGAAARVWDAAALALVAGGGALYAWSHAGMQSLITTQIRAARVDSPNFARWNGYRESSNLALALVAAGVAVGIVSYFRARRAPEAGPAPTAPDAPTA
ncbi:MAG: hypothetical protein HOQ11_16210 [Gemmatimonadaceae bacterium]|nr:hypothetical protein [Gemmatimonadaceae bacterium]NUQ93420.1 hypothetical protein [Gemmatimonadaceae bacterium]NUR20123.1 hypothetical protein [Gemmatimonadaceae bacterium]NUS98946.1 hypothetical protein [Gemmatimonadaceae bacterium]